jgi:hypothetical protein
MEDTTFQIGSRVRLSDLGKQKAKKRDRAGVVVGLSRTGTQVRVLWDDLRQPYLLHSSYLELDDKCTSGAARGTGHTEVRG